MLRSKGAVLIARSLIPSKNLKEIILSFNEINLNAGLEIAKLFASKSNTLKILDLNGNKFGEEGKLEMVKLLEPVGSALCSLSEDEGSDEEEGEQDEDAFDEDEEEEDVEVVTKSILKENGGQIFRNLNHCFVSKFFKLKPKKKQFWVAEGKSKEFSKIFSKNSQKSLCSIFHSLTLSPNEKIETFAHTK